MERSACKTIGFGLSCPNHTSLQFASPQGVIKYRDEYWNKVGLVRRLTGNFEDHFLVNALC